MSKKEYEPMLVKIKTPQSRGPQAGFGTQVIFISKKGDVEIPISEVSNINITIAPDQVITADIEVYPCALEIEAIANVLIKKKQNDAK